MIVLIDTNVLFSAALNRNSTPFKAFVKAVSAPNHGIICKQNIEELRRTFNRKFPDKIQALDTFLSIALITLELATIPDEPYEMENQVRDEYDRPILRAAIYANADIIVTGDKDLLEANLTRPLAVTPAQFLELET